MISKEIGFLLLVILPLMASASDAVLKGEIAVQEVVKLQLIAQSGEVEIRGIKTDTVRWRVELEPQKKGWFTSSTHVREKLGEIKVHSKTDSTILHLDLEYPDGLNDNDVNHKWHIDVPIAFAVNVKKGAGNLNIANVQGGVNGELGTGNAEVTVLAGNVSLKVGTGNANVVSATSSVGTIELHSGLGNASAKIGSEPLASARSGLKADLNHVGDGDDDYWISVGIGNAQLEIKTRLLK